MGAAEFDDTRQRLYSRMPLVGQRQRIQASETLVAAAIGGDPHAARILAEALSSHFDKKIQEMAFAALRALDHPAAIDAACEVWRETRSPELAALIRDCQWVATAPPDLRTRTALLGRCTAIFEVNDVYVAQALLDACAETDATGEATRVLATIGDPGMRETVCERIIFGGCPEAAVGAIAEGGYAPGDESTRALFYFLTGQEQRLWTMEDHNELLARAYDETVPCVRARVLDRLRDWARPDLTAWLLGEERVRTGRVTRTEWLTVLDILREGNAYPRLWNMAACCPPDLSAEIVERLHAHRFTVSNLNESTLLNDLFTLRPVEPRNGRLYLSQPQPQATLMTGLPHSFVAKTSAPQTGFDFVFVADGRELMAAGEELSLWDAWTGACLTTMRGHSQTPCTSVRLIAASPDGCMLAAAEDHDSDASRLWLWARGEEKPVAMLGDDQAVSDIQFSGDGHMLAVAGPDVTRLWDVRKRTLLGSLPGALNCVRWWPRMRLLATSGANGNVRLWDPVARELRRNLEGKAPPVQRMSFSSDGRHIATLHEDRTGRLWSLQEAACVSVLRHDSGLVALAFSPDGTLLATGTGDGTLRLWQVEPFKPHLTLQGPAAEEPRGVRAIAFSPDGRRLASTSTGNDFVSLWSLTSRELAARCGATWPEERVSTVRGDLKRQLREPNQIRFSPTGDSMAARFGPMIQIWTIAHPQPFGAMSSDDLLLAEKMADTLSDPVDSGAWRFAARVLRHRLSS